MPGYEAERAKLRQYLGIEWTPNGLEKMKGKNFCKSENYFTNYRHQT